MKKNLIILATITAVVLFVARIIIPLLNASSESLHFSENHPEMRSDEMFLTNISIVSYQSLDKVLNVHITEDCSEDEGIAENFMPIGYQSKRLGEVAYSEDGHAVNGSRPVFVKKVEFEEAEKARAVGGLEAAKEAVMEKVH